MDDRARHRLQAYNLREWAMVRNIRVEAVDEVARPLIAAANEHPDGHVIPPHRHRRGQLIFGASGTIVLATPQGTWVMPPRRGMWIPPGVVHDVRMLGMTSIQSLYLEPEHAGDMPSRCQVVGISPFLQSLIAEAQEIPVDYDLEGRGGALMSLILHEMRRLPVLPLSLPFPDHAPLAQRCRLFVLKPSVHETIDEWCTPLGISRRAFTRLFRRETGLSFMTWRQQACLVAALPRLASGASITTVAIDLGYDNPAAFTTMFKRVLGEAPRAYLKQRR
ncbi:helix-turn-helix domain-containing protein [Beijerinckia sp. L45]|uniref:AraC family transcriptional regulator n=1 Tax=Beijerinckia sp. L45 TaxID=1641855 RepID=UPI001FEFACBA|nr:helix-turn-helix transcriptional regulator [Beijerinckia sp. L45]